METTVNDAITKLAERAGNEKDSGDAMRFSQAALNLMHVTAVKSNIELERHRLKLL